MRSTLILYSAFYLGVSHPNSVFLHVTKIISYSIVVWRLSAENVRLTSADGALQQMHSIMGKKIYEAK